MTRISDVPAVLRELRAALNLTQEALAERLGVSFATVNRWEGGGNKPQRAALASIAKLADEAGVPLEGSSDSEAVTKVGRRGGARKAPTTTTTKPMEQMLWDAACSIRGEKEAAKFKDYLLPLLFLKRLSDVFDDEIVRLAEDYGDRATALEIAESDHSLLRFYLPPEARWAVISGRASFDWPPDDRGRPTLPRDIGEHLTKAVRAVVKQNPSLSGVIDVVDFAAERNGERDINPAKLRGVVETFSDPRYRMGLADVQPDFLGRAYEYLLRKFAEGSGQSAGEFFTPTEVGLLMAHILRPRPGETCHDYACGSAGLLIKMQLIARELDPTSRVPIKLSGQELQAESYAVAQMNAIIHDMSVELQRGDTMINPKFRDSSGKLRGNDIVVANPMWNQPFAPELFANDPFDRFRSAGGIASGKGDWAWLQHTLACLNPQGRAAIVLDTGAVTRGSGNKNEDKERNIRKWFVDQDLIDGVILLPENLFYNTTAAGVIVVLNKRKSASRKGKITLLNASRHFEKGRPKNYLPSDDVRALAAMYLKGEAVEGELAVIDAKQAEEADYNLSPSRWVRRSEEADLGSISGLIHKLENLSAQDSNLKAAFLNLLASGLRGEEQKETEVGLVPESWDVRRFDETVLLQRGFDLPTSQRKNGAIKVYGSNGPVGNHDEPAGGVPVPTLMIGRSGSVGKVSFSETPCWPLNTTLFASNYFGNEPKYIQYWLEYFDLSRFGQGVSVPTLNRNTFGSVLVAVPTVDEQRDAVAILNAIDRSIEVNREKLAVLEGLFKSLLHKLMTGELRAEDLDLSIPSSLSARAVSS